MLIFAALLVGCAAAPPASEPNDEETAQASEAVQAKVAEARGAAEVGEYAYALELLFEALDAGAGAQVARQAAQLAMAAEDVEAAERAADRWLELEPDARQAAQIAVVAAVLRSRPERAGAVLYDKLVAPAVNPEEAWTAAVGLLGRTGRPAAARLALDEALDRAESPAPGLRDYLFSRLASGAGDTEEARERAERAYEASPGYERAMWTARLALAQADYDAALAWFDRALEYRPGDRSAAIGKVQTLQELRRPDEALAVIEGLPVDAELLYTRGLLQQEAGRIAAAGATWQELVSLDDEQAGPRRAWLAGLLAELLEMPERAVEWYGRVDGEMQPRAELRRAVMLGQLDRVDEARRVLADVRMAGNPEMTERSWLVEGQLLLEQGRADEAVNLYSEALTRLPGSTELLYSRAMAAVELDRLELAEQDLRVIIQNDPDNAVALNALGYTLADLTDRYGEALRLIETALELDPDNAAILDSMGWVLHRLGRDEEALPYLRRAAGAEPHPEIVAHLIDVLWVLGREREAREWVRRYGDDFAEDPVFSETLERLAL